jgi:alkylated DNA repair dioxygenase AlkB
MRTLFDDDLPVQDLPAIPGLFYLEDFLTFESEAELTLAIDSAEWDTTWERRRQLYGRSYGRKALRAAPLPLWGRLLGDRIVATGHTGHGFDQMLVNEYLPGQGIALHCDYEPFDRTVASISLLSRCVMDFRRVADGHRENLPLEPRSLLILSDDARYEWQHGIARRRRDRLKGLTIPRTRRLSVTFRRFKEPG